MKTQIKKDMNSTENMGLDRVLFWRASIAHGLPPAPSRRAVARTHYGTMPNVIKESDAMRKRNKTIAIRCTEEEYQRIHDKAEQYGLKLNDFVIRSALDKKIIVAEGINEIVKQQKAIGRNLNQIATLANMNRLTVVNFQPLLDEHIRATESIGQLLREVK